MAVTIFFIIAAILVVYTFLPLVGRREALVEAGEDVRHRIEALELEKRNYLRAIKDVEFERATGKLDDGDYQELREFYTRKAAEALQALERLREEPRGDRAS